VAWNLAISQWRGRQRLRRWHRDLAHASEPGSARIDPDLVSALATLPSHHRQAVVLHYLAGFSVRDVAEFCGVAEGTVKSWLSRGRTTLHQLLDLDAGEVANA
jgi:RNA polymerase sigma-70 factor (ECF subfamily)